MILYHFCCERDMRGIRNKGIIKGKIAVQARINNHGKPGKFQTYAMAGWQWLTLDSEKEHQSWNTHVLLNYDRTQGWPCQCEAQFDSASVRVRFPNALVQYH